jgi:hypothetical protein
MIFLAKQTYENPPLTSWANTTHLLWPLVPLIVVFVHDLYPRSSFNDLCWTAPNNSESEFMITAYPLRDVDDGVDR